LIPADPGRSPRASAVGLRAVLRGALIACVALLAFTAAASAANYDLRGEWDYQQTCSPCAQSEFHGVAVIRTMEGSGAYSGTQTFEDIFPGTISGTVSENTLSVLLATPSPIGEQTFAMPSGAINPVTNEFTGSGSYNGGGPSQPTGTLTAKRVRTLKQIEEQEEKEKIEREAREKGEKEGRAIGEKAGEKTGLEKGEREGREKGEAEGKAKAEQEVKQKAEQETKERQAKEAQATAELQAREKAAKEAAEKADVQAREKIEHEAREKVEKEAKERKLAEEKKLAEKKRRKKKPRKKPKHKSRGKKG
jgi:hypothetical protein